MTANAMFLAVLALFDGLAVAWGIWEFWSARPAKKAKVEEPDPAPPDSAEASGHSKR
jgi:hypothetical protein